MFTIQFLSKTWLLVRRVNNEDFHSATSFSIMRKNYSNRVTIMPKLPAVRAVISLSLIVLNTLFCFLPVMFLAILKCLLPIASIRARLNLLLDHIATFWIGMNNLNQRCLGRSQITLSGQQTLLEKDWYMLVANHQSWVDILVLQRMFNRRIPFIKFFLKKELIWVPFIGLAWWALEFPFMKRYSPALLKKRPELKVKTSK